MKSHFIYIFNSLGTQRILFEFLPTLPWLRRMILGHNYLTKVFSADRLVVGVFALAQTQLKTGNRFSSSSYQIDVSEKILVIIYPPFVNKKLINQCYSRA